jgi:hypothetical protein
MITLGTNQSVQNDNSLNKSKNIFLNPIENDNDHSGNSIHLRIKENAAAAIFGQKKRNPTAFFGGSFATPQANQSVPLIMPELSNHDTSVRVEVEDM